jgi:hypothetical protein
MMWGGVFSGGAAAKKHYSPLIFEKTPAKRFSDRFKIRSQSERKGQQRGMVFRFRSLLIFLIFILLLSSCAPARPEATPTLVPTISVAAATVTAAPPEQAETPAYPVDNGAALLANTPDPAYPEPAQDGGGPPGVPALENRSRVSVKLLAQEPDPDHPDLIRLHVQVNSVAEVSGMANMAGALENQEADLYSHKADMIELKPGAVFDAEISYRGDENGARYYIVRFIQ